MFLRDHRIGDAEYVLGISNNGTSHAWLEVGGFIVDITGDQFTCHPGAPVVVTQDRRWHCYFQEDYRASIRIEEYDERTRRRLARLYGTVLACVRKHSERADIV